MKIYKINTPEKDYKVISNTTKEWIRTINMYDDLIFFAENENQAKEMFKNQAYIKRFPKQFVIKDITPPNDGKLHTIRGN